MHPLPNKIISGGQTGVDRAALNVAIRLGVPCSGWCPKGRMAEDGAISLAYPLRETPSYKYEVRTEWNVRDSDGTLILCQGRPTGGTAFTLAMCNKLGKEHFIHEFDNTFPMGLFLDWLCKNNVRVLNIAGPRESTCPGIYTLADELLETLYSSHWGHCCGHGAPVQAFPSNLKCA